MNGLPSDMHKQNKTYSARLGVSYCLHDEEEWEPDAVQWAELGVADFIGSKL